MRRTMLVPAVVLILGCAAIGTTTLLDRHAEQSRAAGLSLATLKTSLVALQSAPFTARPETGGSAPLAARTMRDEKQRIAGILAQLQGSSPPASLRALPRALQANYAPLDRIYALGTSPAGYGVQADRQAAIAGRTVGAALHLLDDGRGAYDRRAAAATRAARAGAIGVIVLLLAAFLFLYRQNDRLLLASRREALSDPLTALPNRRALTRDLESALPVANSQRPLVLALFDLDGFKRYNDTFGHPAGDALLARLGERLAAVTARATGKSEMASAYRIGGDEFCVLASVERARRDDLLRACTDALSETGENFSIACSHGIAVAPSEVATAEQALRLADQRLYEEKADRRSGNREIIDVLRTVVSERNVGLEQHLTTVARLARLTAQRLELPADEVDRIQLAAAMHDIGKTAFPDSLLSKPGPLDADEWQFMRTHTLIGERIILAAPSLAHAADLVRSSHERVDGGGYPDGLAGDAIPRGSLIIAVCDAFDAMTCDRPYSAAISSDRALAELRRSAGTQFDPEVVEAFCALAAERPAQLAQAA
jgi:diguanylate cyclase (GGDEF)-like protein